ncbi:MAG: DUF1579 family protein [Thermoanaerobaculia bacterium]
MAVKMEGRQLTAVTSMHKALGTFAGEWKISQKFYTGPGAKPMLATGKATCKVLLGGLAVYMESELDNGYKAIVMSTWNASKGQYEGFFMDIYSHGGFDPLTGMPAANLPVAADAAHNLSDAAVFKGPVRQRVWNGRVTVPRMAALAAGAPSVLAGVDSVPVQIVENQVSANVWALNCISADAAGEQYVQMENTYTKA